MKALLPHREKHFKYIHLKNRTFMRKVTIKAAVYILAGTLTMSSCIGSFGLFNKLLSWNKGIGNKFLNELVFIVISPAYAVCGVADLLVLNTVEFWSGRSPIARVGHVENVWGQDGRLYAVKTMKDGYEVTKPDGDKVYFVHNADDDSWMMKADGKETELFRFNEDGTIQAYLPDGGTINVTQDEVGLYDLRMAANGGVYFAATN